LAFCYYQKLLRSTSEGLAYAGLPSIMKYLLTFNSRLRELRQKKKLSQEDIAAFCNVDVTVVDGWEQPDGEWRSYPVLEQLLDLCLKTGTRLEAILDLQPGAGGKLQMELPGLVEERKTDLYQSISELADVFDDVLPDEMERRLLKRFRKCDAVRKQLILSML
jgi:transcriptional regulator with XRE-family HTH domain